MQARPSDDPETQPVRDTPPEGQAPTQEEGQDTSAAKPEDAAYASHSRGHRHCSTGAYGAPKYVNSCFRAHIASESDAMQRLLAQR